MAEDNPSKVPGKAGRSPGLFPLIVYQRPKNLIVIRDSEIFQRVVCGQVTV
jgi:hypothetical protein